MRKITLRSVARVGLGAALIFAGTTHLTVARKEFQAQVPDFVPLDPDTTVITSGIAEITLGTGLLVASGKQRRTLGGVTAAFFVAIFPGNVSQYLHKRNGFGLDTDKKRLTRLYFQPALIAWALWSTRK